MKPQLCAPLGRILVPTLILLGVLALPFRAEAAPPAPPACSGTTMPTGPTAVVASSAGASTAGSLLVIDASTNGVACTVTVGKTPTNLAISPDSTQVFVENDTDGTVTVVNLADGSIAGTVTLTGAAPMTANLAVSPDNSKVYVVTLPATLTASTQASLYVISLPSLSVSGPTSVVESSATPVTGPGLGIAFTPDATKAYIATEGLTYIVTTSTNAISTTTIPTNGGTMAIDQNGQFASVVDVTSSSSTPVSRITISTNAFNTLTNVTPVCTQANTTAIHPPSATNTTDSNIFYYTCPGSSFVQALDFTSGTPSAAVEQNLTFGGANPQGIAFATDGNSAYVSLNNSTVGIINTSASPNAVLAVSIADPGLGSLGAVSIVPTKLSPISPTSATVPTGGTQQFSTTIKYAFGGGGTPIWSVNGVVGGNAASGTIDATGKYTAPNTLPPSPSQVTISVSSSTVPAVSKIYPLSATVTLTPSQLAFTVQPTAGTAGTALAPVAVSVEDASGTVVTTDTSTVNIAINGGGALTGGSTTSVAAVNGVATFSNLVPTVVGSFTLSASDGALTGATSSTFAVTAGAPAKLVFSAQPTNTVSGAAIAPAVQVSIEDAFGNLVTTATNAVTIAIGTNPSGGTLSGTVTVNAVAGVASFSTLSINKVGTGYTLSATSGALTSATSNTFNITAGLATKVAFTVQPTNVIAGVAITPAVQVTIEDASGNVVSSTNSVTISIGTNPGGGTLSGTLTLNAVAGVATFSTLSINKVGTGYTLAATSGALAVATSNTFNVAPAAPAALVFSIQPTTAVAGATITPAVQVNILDAFGNLASSATNAVTVAIGTNPGGGTLSGTLTVNAVAGMASFSTLSINKTGTGYTLSATSGALIAATSTAFNITPGLPAKLGFTVQPANVVAASPIAPPVQVSIQDINGNLVPTAANAVTVAIGTNPGGGTLSGTLTVNAAGGVASFSTLSINKTGNGYTLGATAAGLAAATSNAFNVTPGAPTQLLFTTQPPANGNAGTAVTAVVSVEDANGNVVTTSTAPVAISSTPANVGGTTNVNAAAGVAAFNNLQFTLVGSYTLTASSAGLTSATSTSIAIAPGPPNKVVFTTQPPATSPLGGNTTPLSPVAVSIEDAFGNLETTSAASVTISSTPANVSGVTAVTATNGVATFSGLDFTIAGTYTFTASSAGLTSGTSSALTLTTTITDSITSNITTVNIEDVSDTFAGKANGDPNNPSLGVTWKIISCGGSTTNLAPCGTLAANGTYTPPNKVPVAPGNVFVAQVTAAADPTKVLPTGNITIGSTITVAVSATTLQPNTVVFGFPAMFSATLTNAGTINTVTWNPPKCTAGPTANCGSIDAQGNYTAPPTPPNPPTFTVTATSDADQSKVSPPLGPFTIVPDLLLNDVAQPSISVPTAPATSGSAVVDLFGPNAGGPGTFTLSCSIQVTSGSLTNGTCGFGATANPFTAQSANGQNPINVTLTVLRTASAPPVPPTFTPLFFRGLPIYLELFTCALLAFLFWRFTDGRRPRALRSYAFVLLAALALGWLSGCGQFTPPGQLPPLVGATQQAQGTVTISITPTGAGFTAQSVTVPFKVN